MHKVLRAWMRTRYGSSVAASVRILYGGSVTAVTVDELMQKEDVDGVLVGGTSLDATAFARIVMHYLHTNPSTAPITPPAV